MRRVFALSILFLAGCQYDPFTAVYTRSQPKAEDLVGRYVPDSATRRFIGQNYPQEETSIVLSADGAIVIQNIPDCWLTGFGEPKGGFDSGRGKWTIERHQEWWVVGATFESTEQFASQEHRVGGFGTDLFLIGEKSPYKIHLVVGDPDGGHALEFERTKP